MAKNQELIPLTEVFEYILMELQKNRISFNSIESIVQKENQNLKKIKNEVNNNTLMINSLNLRLSSINGENQIPLMQLMNDNNTIKMNLALLSKQMYDFRNISERIKDLERQLSSDLSDSD